mgnify:CR=1 FL=1
MNPYQGIMNKLPIILAGAVLAGGLAAAYWLTRGADETGIRLRPNDTAMVARGGQIFFLHNNVRSIGAMQSYLKRLVPQARTAIAHGQMSGDILEKTMDLFIDKKIDMLVCSTIIESGLDIPNANTIIINRADKFGLSQLYQLRGRVGRDRHRAYAYLLVPKTLSKTARLRLKAVEELSELGSGYKLAARDLEIRGSGNLLGAQQSGNIGFLRLLGSLAPGKGQIALDHTLHLRHIGL